METLINWSVAGILWAFLFILFMIGCSFALDLWLDCKKYNQGDVTTLPAITEPCPIRAQELAEQEVKLRNKMNGLEQKLFYALFDKYKCPENERFIRELYFLSLTNPAVEGVSFNKHRLSEEAFKIDIDKLAL